MSETPAQATHDLPLMTFRGLESPPYDTAGFVFKHSQPQRNYPNISRATHDWQGMESEALAFRLYFLNTLGRGILFPNLWNPWWRALKDGRPGPMLHPLLNEIDVVPIAGSVELIAQVTCGVVVDCQFEATLIDPSAVAQESTIRVELKSLAKAADVAANQAGINMPSGVVEQSLLELVGQLDGYIFAMENLGLGIINRVKNTIDSMVNFIDRRDPRQTAQVARQALVALWVSVDDLAQEAGSQLRPIQFVKLGNDTGLQAFAAENGMTLTEAIELNPHALLAPVVRKGTVLQAYT